jgi:hypothetical protein
MLFGQELENATRRRSCVVHQNIDKVLFALPLDEGRTVKTATNRAAEAIEAAETLFADEMGATLDPARAAKAVLMATIAAAIEAAIAEERERLVCAQ